METQKQRIIGFDLARAYAIFGMYIVNYNVVFGDYYDESWAGKFLSLFSGNSSSVFVMLAGMGVALMSNRSFYTEKEKRKLRYKLFKRAAFLLGMGILLSLWWPADILHFYAVYMVAATFILFSDRNIYLYVAAFSVILFHLLLILIPYDTGWNFDTLEYVDFWTFRGFLRSTFYNGWNSVFPWLAYFSIGMYCGRLDWTLAKTQKKMFLLGLILYLGTLLVQSISGYLPLNKEAVFYLHADYLPPFLPFLISTTGFGLMLIAFFMFISRYLSENEFAKDLAKTGQMTLTHYISHLTVGLLVFICLRGGDFEEKEASHPLVIFGFSCAYFMLSYYFSKFWASRYRLGPFEMLNRKISG